MGKQTQAGAGDPTPTATDPMPTEPTPGAPGQPDPTPNPAPPAAKQDEPLGEAGLKALQAERDAREKAERDLAALRKEIEDSQKTAEEKAADALAAAQAEAAENAAKALRYEVAAAKGLDLALAPRLTGTTREELEADADVLMGLIPKPEPAPAAPAAQPVPTVAQSPGTPTGNVSLADQIAAAQAAGDKQLVATLKAMQLGQQAT